MLLLQLNSFIRDHNINLKLITSLLIREILLYIISISFQFALYSRYFIQLSAIKSLDISGRQEYGLGVKDISFSPQCLGLGVPENKTCGCKKQDMEWRHDMDLKELAYCMGKNNYS